MNRLLLPTSLLLTLLACTPRPAPEPEQAPAPEIKQDEAAPSAADVQVHPNNEAFFGNFHVHTSWSFDAYTNGSVTTPDDAFRWAKGEAIRASADGGELKVETPLDWYVVSDHAEYLGVFKQMEDPDSPFSKLAIAQRITSDDDTVAFAAFSEVLDKMNENEAIPELVDPALSTTIWKDVVRIAEEHNQPGRFTAFPGFEWTSAPGERNLHRVVIFKDQTGVPDLPFSSFDSNKPEELWRWMDATRQGGASLLAVAHNGNASEGLMFPVDKSFGGSSLDAAYADARTRNEPVYEVTQIKGTSETHPTLSPNDEFANFELWQYTLSANANPSTVEKGGYAREALIRGLALDAAGQGNPFKFGLIGDSDTHNSASTPEEDNYTGKFAIEWSPEVRKQTEEDLPPKNALQMKRFSSGGLAGVWARSNTRDALFESIQRKETFATTGPRIKVRTFAGWDFDAQTMSGDGWIETAYAGGVPMGGDLSSAPEGKSPTLLIMAMAEPGGAHLDRIQVIKGWVQDGKPMEQIHDVALSGDRTVAEDGSVPPVGNTVDVANASYTNDIGAPQLSAVWTDPDFDASQHALYYVRVLQIPTPRWSTYDAKRLGDAPSDEVPTSIQERAWTSPIWYTP